MMMMKKKKKKNWNRAACPKFVNFVELVVLGFVVVVVVLFAHSLILVLVVTEQMNEGRLSEIENNK